MNRRVAKKIVKRAHPSRYDRDQVRHALRRLWRAQRMSLGSLAPRHVDAVIRQTQLQDDLMLSRHEWRRPLTVRCYSDSGVHGPLTDYGHGWLYCETCTATDRPLPPPEN